MTPAVDILDATQQTNYRMKPSKVFAVKGRDRCSGPGPAEWDRHKDQIKFLYQGMILKDVAKIMREEHGFDAK